MDALGFERGHFASVAAMKRVRGWNLVDGALNQANGIGVSGNARDSGLRVAEIGECFGNIAREVNALRRWLVLMRLAFGSYVHWLGLLSMIRGLLTSGGGRDDGGELGGVRAEGRRRGAEGKLMGDGGCGGGEGTMYRAPTGGGYSAREIVGWFRC